MKFKINSNKGMSLSTIVISIILMIIILSTIILSVNKTSETKEAMQLNNDIEELTRRVNLYHMQNGIVPIEEKYSEYIVFEKSGLEEEFYLLNISVFDNLNLKNKEDITKNEDGSINVRKGYLINKETHLIYYMEWDRDGDGLLPVKYKYSEGYEEFFKRAKMKMKQVEKIPEEVESGEILKFSISGDQATVIGLTEYGKSIQDLELVIPKYYKGKLVTKIGYYTVKKPGYRKEGTAYIYQENISIRYGAFYNCTNIKSVNLGDIDTIVDANSNNFYELENGKYVSKASYYGAFFNCTNMEKVEGTKVKRIGTYSFDKCSKLNNVNIPNAITAAARSFQSCISLINLELKNVTSIGDGTFFGCNNLENLSLGLENKIKIAAKAFYGCSNLKLDVTELKLDQTVVYNRTFWGCGQIKGDIDLSKIKEIGELAFANCYNINIKDGNLSELIKVDNSAFRMMDSNRSKIKGNENGELFLNKLEILTYGVFGNCYLIQRIEMPKIKRIEDGYDDGNLSNEGGVFRNCDNIREIVIGKDLEYIGAYAFYACKALKNIYYMEDGEKKQHNFESVTYIGKAAFYANDILGRDENRNATLTLNLCKLVKLGENAFWSCKGLSNIYISNLCTTVEKNVFRTGLAEEDKNNLPKIYLVGLNKPVEGNVPVGYNDKFEYQEIIITNNKEPDNFGEIKKEYKYEKIYEEDSNGNNKLVQINIWKGWEKEWDSGVPETNIIWNASMPTF